MGRSGTPFRLLFLGDRRIAADILDLIAAPEFRGLFDLRVLVSGPALLDRHAGKGEAAPLGLRNNARHGEALETLIREQRIDLLLSIQHNWILPQSVLDAVDGEAYNLHNAKLPDYKGYNSISHALLNEERVYCPTLHRMAQEVDSGPIVHEGRVDIRPDDSAYSLYPRTVAESVRIVRQFFETLKSGEQIPLKPMAEGRGRFYERSELSELADVSAVTDPQELDRRVRALFFPPLNAAYRLADGRKHYLVPEGALATGWSSSAPLNQIGD